MKEYGRTIPYKINAANSFIKRLKGLMFRKEPLVDEGLWITPCNSIHMCFMRFSIDAVFISKEGKIVRIVEDLQPWKMVKPVQGAHSVLELPSGAVHSLSLKVGDFIKL
ncbi:hypothetical protein SAMN05192533_10775 [Mesobacillus persicus]|uniref:DUF192 domain-containing protein n=1 Tax=Mesobacillus persicus TaxID=930146 RepID=A0A1H8CGE9_9BACI|nr:DUF192 domain-containing protein [Mesobacillus persicus]SEM94070.1 hypothetical protein SAMN05192533_10775 [Mesobacillus persicus]